jgi:hypothetical protein
MSAKLPSFSKARVHATRTLRLLVLSAAAVAGAASPLLAQKTDTLIVRNGDVWTGEIREYVRGKVTFSTDAASTIYVKWTRVLSAESDKLWDIDLEDGSKLLGSLDLGDEHDQLKIITDGDTLVVATQSVVALRRIKETFWKRLDGSIDLGVDFTQQNAKTDLNFGTKVMYKKDFNTFRFDLYTTFSRQDDTENISRLNTSFTYLREFAKGWFYAGVVRGEQNSQLSLDIRGTASAAGGRMLIQSNKVLLAAGLGLGYARELYTGQEGTNAFQGAILADFEFFSWGGLDTDLSTRLIVTPVFTDWGRWRISSITSFQREIVSWLYFNVTINEQFDSRPPTFLDTNKNDLSITTSLGWTF